LLADLNDERRKEDASLPPFTTPHCKHTHSRPPTPSHTHRSHRDKLCQTSSFFCCSATPVLLPAAHHHHHHHRLLPPPTPPLHATNTTTTTPPLPPATNLKSWFAPPSSPSGRGSGSCPCSCTRRLAVSLVGLSRGNICPSCSSMPWSCNGYVCVAFFLSYFLVFASSRLIACEIVPCGAVSSVQLDPSRTIRSTHLSYSLALIVVCLVVPSIHQEHKSFTHIYSSRNKFLLR